MRTHPPSGKKSSSVTIGLSDTTEHGFRKWGFTMLQSAHSKLFFCLAIVGYAVFCTSEAANARPPSVLAPRQQASVIAEGAEYSSSWEFPSDSKKGDMKEFVATDDGFESEPKVYSKTYEELTAAPMPEVPESEEDESAWSFFTPSFTPSFSNQCDSSNLYGGNHCNECSTHGGIFGNLLCRHHGQWVARFDSLILWRNAPTDRTIFLDATGTTPVLNADQLESDVLAAPRLSLFHINQCGYGIEATYIYAGNFYSERGPFTDVTQADIYNNPPVGGGADYTSAQAKLLGRFQSFELNGRTPMGVGNVQFISGFRWLQWKEWAEVTGSGAAPVAGTRFTDTFNTECFNDLYGGQIGFDALLYQSPGGFRLESVIKAGAYYNAAVQGSTLTVSDPATTKSVRVSGTPAGGAFMGELGLTGVIPIHNCWDFRFGYTGFWLESLAQPINQFSGQTLLKLGATPDSGSLTTTGRLVLQGLSLGLEGRW